MKNKAFTLAEVLITLAIISVVAAITISGVVADYQKTQTISKLKKFYNSFYQVYALSTAKHGSMINWDIGRAGDGIQTMAFLNQYIIPYLKVVDKPQIIAESNLRKTYFYMNGTESSFPDGFVYFRLNDGSAVRAKLNNQDADLGHARELLVFYDTNGESGPNRMGRDIFIFIYDLAEDRRQGVTNFRPYSYVGLKRKNLLSDGDKYNCNKNQRGFRCSAVIMMDGWRISDDYPW